ncbi:MAG: response regulator transcription factor [Treponema sp.]|jgi:DNA-binding NarL/FixJ family response regulator|nr:response regulator transcription factor [Treponema sp.]
MGNIIRIFVNSRYDEDRKRILDILSDQNDFRITGIEKDEAGTIIKSAQLKPDVLVLDLQPQGLGGEELAPIIHRRSPSTAIVMLCDKDEDDYAGLALKAGISGFLLKEYDTDKLVPVIKIVSSGGYYISASITIRVFSAVTFIHTFPGQITERRHTIFSPAERGIVTDIAQGLSDEEIAKHLHFSTGTIKNCLTAIKRKTKLKNRVQIVVYSLIYGLISFEQLGFGIKAPWINDANTDKEIEDNRTPGSP